MLKSSEIRKSILGIVITDGYIDIDGRFQFSSKYPEYRDHVVGLFNQFPNNENKIWTNDYYDKRYNVYTYKMVANYPAYFSKMRNRIYTGSIKQLSKKTIQNIDERVLAYMWMSDGYLQHQKNRQKDKIQNNGAFCLESFTEIELQNFIDYSKERFDVEWYLKRVPWGNGYRPVTSGLNLQKLINIIYPYVIPVFAYKTKLFYKTLDYCNMNLTNAEHIFVQYQTIQEYEDIVRTSK